MLFRSEQVELIDADPNYRRPFRYHVDPSADEFLGALYRSQSKTLRGFLGNDGRSYWWAAEDLHHSGGLRRIVKSGVDIPYDSARHDRARAVRANGRVQRMIQCLLVYADRLNAFGNKPFSGFASETGRVAEVLFVVSPKPVPAGVYEIGRAHV